MSKQSGVVKFYDTAKGYGFIRSDDDGKEYFAHWSGLLTPRAEPLVKGEAVSFEVVAGDRGPKAANVQRVRVKL